jgi:hypothetical protein
MNDLPTPICFGSYTGAFAAENECYGCRELSRCVSASDKPPVMGAKRKQIGGDHYVNQGVQPWDVIDTWPLEQQIGYYRGNAVKYLMRMGNKDDRLQEVEKAAHYIEKLIEVIRDHTAEEKGTGAPIKGARKGDYDHPYSASVLLTG